MTCFSFFSVVFLEVFCGYLIFFGSTFLDWGFSKEKIFWSDMRFWKRKRRGSETRIDEVTTTFAFHMPLLCLAPIFLFLSEKEKKTLVKRVMVFDGFVAYWGKQTF